MLTYGDGVGNVNLNSLASTTQGIWEDYDLDGHSARRPVWYIGLG